VRSTRHRIQYLTFGAIMGSKSGETRHKCGLPQSLMPDSPTHRHSVHHIGLDWSRQEQFVRGSFISRYSPHSQRALNVGRSDTNFTFSLLPIVASHGVASCDCRKFHIDKFFCDRHTIVAAASQFAVRANSLNGLRCGSGTRTGLQAPFLIASRLPEHSIKRHISPTC
jgi:hypothetical protein